jgi:hypothetical protein
MRSGRIVRSACGPGSGGSRNQEMDCASGPDIVERLRACDKAGTLTTIYMLGLMMEAAHEIEWLRGGADPKVRKVKDNEPARWRAGVFGKAVAQQ